MDEKNFDLMNLEFLRITNKLENDRIFFHLDQVKDDVAEQYGMNIMALLAVNTYTGFTDEEVIRNRTSDTRHTLMAVRLSDMCVGVIEKLEEIQEKLKGEMYASNKKKTTSKLQGTNVEQDSIDQGTSDTSEDI